METAIKRITELAASQNTAAWSEGLRMARYGWLNELPGLAFGLLSVIYLVTSLVALL